MGRERRPALARLEEARQHLVQVATRRLEGSFARRRRLGGLRLDRARPGPRSQDAGSSGGEALAAGAHSGGAGSGSGRGASGSGLAEIGAEASSDQPSSRAFRSSPPASHGLGLGLGLGERRLGLRPPQRKALRPVCGRLQASGRRLLHGSQRVEERVDLGASRGDRGRGLRHGGGTPAGRWLSPAPAHRRRRSAPPSPPAATSAVGGARSAGRFFSAIWTFTGPPRDSGRAARPRGRVHQIPKEVLGREKTVGGPLGVSPPDVPADPGMSLRIKILRG